MSLLSRSSCGLLAIVLVASVACEDETARVRAEAQTQIALASRDLELASLVPVVPGDESFDTRRRTLEEVSRSLGSLPDAEKGQQAAAAIVAAAAERELAGMHVAAASDVVAEIRRQREMVQSHIDAAMRLDAVARGRELLSTVDERTALSLERTQAERQLREYSRAMAALDGPIAERVNENERDAGEAARLDQEASALRRQAAEWGHYEGLQQFLNAIDLERQADRFEYDIAQRDNDLRYDLEPEHALARRHVEQFQRLLREIRESESSLETHERLSAGEVETTRRLVASFRDRISDVLQTLETETTDTLEPQLAKAESSLEKAARQATRAAGLLAGEEADASRLDAARAHEQLASVHAGRTRRLRDQASILARLAAADGVLGDPARYSSELSVVEAAREESMAAALESLAAAQAELEKIRGRGSRTEVDSFKASLAELVEILTADPGTQSASTSMPSRDGGASATPAGEDCHPSPQSIADFMTALDSDDLEAAGEFLDMVQATTPAARALVEAQRQALGPVRDLFAAVEETFSGPGAEQFRSGASQGMGSVSFENVEVVDESETRATLRATVPSSPTGTDTVDLVKIGDCWLIDGESLTDGMDAATIRQQTAMMAPMLDIFEKLAERIRGGEFASAEQAMQAFMTELMGGMGGMGGTGGLEPPSK